ncbi:hypothetical protein [Maribacter sp. IgM3_T14_3]|uniref:hypothetical protein n=1 Tax=Maribacter sp. IgM3_T14_3 TaxID=3415140 RepID=UPI003C705D9B
MNLNEKTTEKLESELKGMKIVTGALIIILGTSFLLCLYNIFYTRQEREFFSSLIAVPIVLSAIIPINFGNMKKIKGELKSRK